MPLGEVLLEPDPEVPPEDAPPEVLPDVPEPEVLPEPDALPEGDEPEDDWSLEDEPELDGLDELPEAAPELGVLGELDAPEDELELGELGVVALPDIEPLDPERLVASLDEPELELDVAPGPPLAPRFASPPRSQP